MREVIQIDQELASLCFFDEHTLMWNHKKFTKTFHTATSGLPECLFNTGYSKFNAYSTLVRNHYNNSIPWAFVNKVHIIEDFEGEQVETKVKDFLSFLKGKGLFSTMEVETRRSSHSRALIL